MALCIMTLHKMAVNAKCFLLKVMAPTKYVKLAAYKIHTIMHLVAVSAYVSTVVNYVNKMFIPFAADQVSTL